MTLDLGIWTFTDPAGDREFRVKLHLPDDGPTLLVSDLVRRALARHDRTTTSHGVRVEVTDMATQTKGLFVEHLNE